MEYYISRNGSQEGPFSIEQLSGMNLTPDTLVWADGMADWQPASQVAELASLFAATAQPVQPAEPAQIAQPEPQYAPGQTVYQQDMPPCPSSNQMMAIVAGIFSLLGCCCFGAGVPGLVLSIIALVKANSVQGRYDRDDFDGALQASKTAKLLAFIALGVDFVLGVGGAVLSFPFLLI